MGDRSSKPPTNLTRSAVASSATASAGRSAAKPLEKASALELAEPTGGDAKSANRDLKDQDEKRPETYAEWSARAQAAQEARLKKRRPVDERVRTRLATELDAVRHTSLDCLIFREIGFDEGMTMMELAARIGLPSDLRLTTDVGQFPERFTIRVFQRRELFVGR